MCDCRDFASCLEHASERSRLEPRPLVASTAEVHVWTTAETTDKYARLRAARSPELLDAVAALRWSASGEWSARVTPEQSRAVLDMLGVPV